MSRFRFANPVVYGKQSVRCGWETALDSPEAPQWTGLAFTEWLTSPEGDSVRGIPVWWPRPLEQTGSGKSGIALGWAPEGGSSVFKLRAGGGEVRADVLTDLRAADGIERAPRPTQIRGSRPRWDFDSDLG